MIRRLSVKMETIQVELNFQTGTTTILEERWEIIVFEWHGICSQIEVSWLYIVLMIGTV